MAILRLLVRVAPDKRAELLQSLQELLDGARIEAPRALILQDIDDRSRLCWMGEWDALQDAETFVGSDTFRALRGAAQVLGVLEDLRLLHDRGPPNAGSREGRRE